MFKFQKTGKLLERIGKKAEAIAEAEFKKQGLKGLRSNFNSAYQWARNTRKEMTKEGSKAFLANAKKGELSKSGKSREVLNTEEARAIQNLVENQIAKTAIKNRSSQLSNELLNRYNQRYGNRTQRFINDNPKVIKNLKRAGYTGGITGGLGLGFYGVHQHTNSLPSNISGYEPSEQDSLNYVNFFMSPEERALYGSNEDYLREVYNNHSASDAEGHNSFIRKAIPYTFNQGLNFKSIPQSTIDDDLMAQIYAVAQAFKPDWKEAKKQLQKQGYVSWDTYRGNNGGRYPAYKLFPNGVDGNGLMVDQASGWGTLGQHEVRWYPKQGLVFTDTYDFNPDAIEDSKKAIIELAKLKNIADTIPSRTNFKLMKAAIDAGMANVYGEAIADPTKHSDVTWTISPDKIRQFNRKKK